MTLNWKRKWLDNPVILFNDEFLSMSENSSNNILAFKFFSDKVGEPIDFDSTFGADFSNKRYFAFCYRKADMASGISVFLKTEAVRYMSERFPESVSESSRQSCAIVFCLKPSVGLAIVTIFKKPMTGSPERLHVRTVMPLKYPCLPQSIETLNCCVSAGFCRRNKNHMNAEEQMQSENLGDTVPAANHLWRGIKPKELPIMQTWKPDISILVRTGHFNFGLTMHMLSHFLTSCILRKSNYRGLIMDGFYLINQSIKLCNGESLLHKIVLQITLPFWSRRNFAIEVEPRYFTIDTSRCLPYAHSTPCIVCEEVCPTPRKAVWFEKAVVKNREGKEMVLQQPRVDADLCVGCGICEAKCPVKSRPAIYITNAGESRSEKNRLLL